LLVFSDAGFSAAAPAASDVVAGRCDVAKVYDIVTSKVRHLQQDYGINVTPSRRLPFVETSIVPYTGRIYGLQWAEIRIK